MKLCLATNNRHKIEELQAILGNKFELVTLEEIGCFDEIPETQPTMEGNSLQKAQYVYDHYGVNCFADDSGLEVDALSGEPGVYSARYAGEERSHAKNIEKLLANLEGVEDRSAQFRAVITLILDGKINQFEGIVRGKIIDELRGNGGFGYDPVFVPEGYDKTFAEMTMDEKNPISHRGRSVAKLVEFLSNT
ncbi:MAG: non-canonical purine NTP diphosphatase [Spirosomataceae bacterium]